MKMKVTFMVLLVILALGCLVGCGNNTNTTSTTDNTPTISSSVNNVQPQLDLLNESFEGSGYWTYESDMFMFYDSGKIIMPFLKYYKEYGATDDFYDSLDSIINSFMTVAGNIGDDAIVAIVNPVNTDNVLLVVNKDEILYNAFVE